MLFFRSRLTCMVALTLLGLAQALAVAKTDLHPSFYAIDNSPQLNASLPWENTTQVTLDRNLTTLTLDYGTEAAGYPFLVVEKLSSPVQVEVKYGEQFAALEAPFGDGPWSFVSAGSNTFRTETLTLTRPGRVQSYFVQGGQRWQSIRLLTTNSTVSLSAGLNLTSSRLSPQELPGQFGTSDPLYDEIFHLGGRAVQAACVDVDASPPTWDITPEGALIRGQQTSQSVLGVRFSNYTLEFSTKIVRGGTGFRVASAITPFSSYFVITSEYPTGSTFSNANRTLLPPNHLVYGFGWSIVNQTSLNTGYDQYFPLNRTIREGQWYRIGVNVTRAGYLVTVNGTKAAFVPPNEAMQYIPTQPLFSTGSVEGGTWGFGPFQDQVAYVRDVKVTAQNGTVLYQNSMTSPQVLTEYSVAANPNPVCLDGAKRDRLVWIGDFFHTCRVVLASTYRTDYLRGTISQAFQWAADNAPYTGFAAMSSPLNGRPEFKIAYGPNQYDLIDYQDLFAVSIADYYQATGDLSFIKLHWNDIKSLMSTRLSFNDNNTGLTNAGPGAYFLGPNLSNGTAPSALNALALRSMTPLATAVGDHASAERYTTAAARINDSLNRLLWNPQLGTYQASLEDAQNFDIASIAFTIRAGIANASQTASMISSLSKLRLGIGFKSSSSTQSTNSTTLSPFILGFLLESLFIANKVFSTPLDPAKFLLDTFWAAMTNIQPNVQTNIQTHNRSDPSHQNEPEDRNHWQYYSGATWESLTPTGQPGIDLFTSLSHPWGAAPTYILPQYVLGVSATSPGFRTWAFEPLIHGHGGGLGLNYASGRVPTSYGSIVARWSVGSEWENTNGRESGRNGEGEGRGNKIGNQTVDVNANETVDVKWVDLEILAPEGTSGEIILPIGRSTGRSTGMNTTNTMGTMDGEEEENGKRKQVIQVNGGEKRVVRIRL